jgi:acyl-CoA oxidase
MCGGHGHLAMPGLSGTVTSVTATCTFEGENFVMWGQAAKYLLKGFDASTLPGDVEYMGKYRLGKNTSIDSIDTCPIF